MVNTLLVFLLLLVSTAFAVSEERVTFLKDVNRKRAEYAKQYSIPDMHQLVWSEDLVTILKSLDYAVAWPTARQTWRYSIIKSYQNFSGEVENEMEKFWKLTEDERKTEYKGTMNLLEFLNPRQTVIGCHLIANGTKANVTVCLVGPEGESQLWDMNAKSSGAPGSACMKNYNNVDELCVVSDQAEITYLGVFRDFHEELNAVRQKYAKEYNVPNMHKLSLDEDLKIIINSLNWANDWPGARNTWRYAKLPSYRNITQVIDDEFKLVIQKSEDDMNALYKKTLGSLELLSPLQSLIGCGTHFYQGVIFPVCLVGTQGDGQLWDFKTKSTETPGSACSPGFTNTDGLCVTEKQVSYIGNHETFLPELNAMRQKYANEYSVPNMHQLVWSEDLVRILENLNMKANWPEARKTWRYASLVSYRKISQFIDDEMKTAMNKTEAQLTASAKSSMGRVELMSPLQTVIGCSKKEAGNVISPVCLIGPLGVAQLWDFSRKSPDGPGSACSPHYKNANGLCTPEDPARASYLGYQEDFLVELNSLRRKYANEYNIPNMHQLVWNQSLVEILDSLDWSKKWPEARITWRYVKLVSYRNPADYVEQGLKEYQGKTEDEKKEVYKTKSPTGLELLYPHQTTIGCGTKSEGTTIFSVCLLGNVGMWPELAFNPDSNVVPGSECLDGFDNSDGLCSVPRPTPKPYKPYPKPATKKAPTQVQRIPQEVPSAQLAATAEPEAEPDTAPTHYSPYLMIAISMYFII